MMDRTNKEWDKLISWALAILGFMTFWPLGLIALLRILSSGSLFSKRQRITGAERGRIFDVPYVEVGSEDKRTGGPLTENKKLVPVKMHWGRGLRVLGTILAVLGGVLVLNGLEDLTGPLDLFTDMAMESGYLAAGLAMLGMGISRGKRAVRYRRYLSLIGERDALSIDALAEAMPVSYKRACGDLLDMIEAGHLPAAGRLDQNTRRLLLSSALEDAPPAGRERPVVKAGDAALREIKELNGRIGNAVMRRKIDRIGEITARILDYQRSVPDPTEELRKFLDYYLPATLKLLHAYAKMEAQGVEGKNISEVKTSIEAAIDKVVDGFEKQLDKLFRTDALDITSDIQVLEQMLQKDGLTADGLFF